MQSVFGFVTVAVLIIAVVIASFIAIAGFVLVRVARRFMGVSPDVPSIEPIRPSGSFQVGPVSRTSTNCTYELCLASNRMNARFCRRCGKKLLRQQASNSRVAAL